MAPRQVQFNIGNLAASPVDVGFSDFRSIHNWGGIQKAGRPAQGNFVTLNPGQTCLTMFIEQTGSDSMFYFYLGDKNAELYIGSDKWYMSYNQKIITYNTLAIGVSPPGNVWSIWSMVQGPNLAPDSDIVTVLCHGPNEL
jgi:hypothetical protein